MNDSLRRYTFKLYPRPAQRAAMEAQRRLHCDLYNGALQERIDAYRLCVDPLTGKGKTLSYYDQCKGLTATRAALPEYAALSSDSMAATAQRVDRAFQAFFRRAKAGMGAQSGFPRYKSGRTYPGFSFKKHGSGWRLDWRDQGAKPTNGKLYIKGVPGLVTFRGRLPARPESIKTCDLLWREDAWWLSLVVGMAPRREAGQGKGEVRFDLVDKFCVVKNTDGGRAAGPAETVFIASKGRIIPRIQGFNPGPGQDPSISGADHGRQQVDQDADNGQDPSISGADHGMRCRRSRAQARQAQQWRESLHRWTTEIAARFKDLDIVAPKSIKDETASGRGDEREWGAQVALKAALNRRVLDQAPAAAIQMLLYKVSEAGGEARLLEDAEPKIGIGNLIVQSTKKNRSASRKAKRERASIESDRAVGSGV